MPYYYVIRFFRKVCSPSLPVTFCNQLKAVKPEVTACSKTDFHLVNLTQSVFMLVHIFLEFIHIFEVFRLE